MITKNVKLYLTGGFPVRIPVSQFDSMWQFVFTIIKDGLEWTIPTGASAVLNGLKPDGNVFAFSGTISNNAVTVDCDVQMTAVAGDTICELSILSDGLTVGTANFVLAVEAAPKSPSDISSNSTLPAYAEMLEMFSGDIEDEVDSWLNAHSSQIGGLTNEAKQALLTLLAHVAYTDDQGQTYLDALEAALYPPADLVSISAVFTQGSAVIYDTDSLDTLKQYLTVTALYSDSSTAVVTTYTLSGTLTVGTSTITASYGGKTTTFTVAVTERNPSLYNWNFTESLVDSKQGATATLVGSPTRNENGLSFTAASQCVKLGAVLERGRAIEVDFTGFNLLAGDNNKRLIMYAATDDAGTGTGLLICRKTSLSWNAYTGAWASTYGITGDTAFANSTVRLEVSSTGVMSLYKNGELVGNAGTTRVFPDSAQYIFIGSSGTASNGGDIHDCTVTGVRIYEVE